MLTISKLNERKTVQARKISTKILIDFAMQWKNYFKISSTEIKIILHCTQTRRLNWVDNNQNVYVSNSISIRCYEHDTF